MPAPKPPKSLEIKPEEIPPWAHARVHMERADKEKEPHRRYLELWVGFEAMYKGEQKGAEKLLQNRRGGRAAGEADLVGAALTSLTAPRVQQLLAHPDIPTLNMLLARKNLKRLLGDNEFLQEHGLNEAAYQLAKKDLTFNLKANYWKAAEGLGRMLLIIRGAADPKVRKTDNVVSDAEILKAAYEVLRSALRTLVDQVGESAEGFMEVGSRQEVAKKEREALIKKLRERAEKAQKAADEKA